jgi:uncharacterized Zn finger protein/superfamily II DNA or RNA helicase
MAEKFGKTWWGEHWLRALEHVDYDNRLPRGASYARSGHVTAVKIKDNQIAAKVRGTRATPYKVTLIVPPFTPAQNEALMERLLTRPAIISKLLNRELDPEILTLAESLGLAVFPRQWTDFKMLCSCPDWAVPCKHLASVIYMVSREIDNNPFLVFTLHRLDLLAELAQRGLVAADHDKAEIPTLASLLVAAPEAVNGDVRDDGRDAVYQRLDFSRLESVGETLVRLLPDAPPFYPGGNFRDKYAAQMARISRDAGRILAGRLNLATIFPEDGAISRRSAFALALAGGGQSGQVEIGGEHHEITAMTGLIPALFAVNAGHLADYQPSAAALHRVLFAALHLLARGLAVPQIVRLDGKDCMLRWLPATLDERVRTLLEQLAAILPPDLLRLKSLVRKKERLAPLANQATELLSLFFAALIARLAKPSDDLYEDMFFRSRPHAFAGVGEGAASGGIKVWLDRYHLGGLGQKAVLTVNEAPDDQFDLSIGIETTGEAPVPLRNILTQKQHEKNRFAILRELSLLTPFITGLDAHINRQGAEAIRFNANAFGLFLMDILPAIRLLAIKVVLPRALRDVLRPKPAIRLKRKSKEALGMLNINALFDFDWQVALGDQAVSYKEFNQALRGASRLFKFKERYFYVSDSDLEKLKKTFTEDRELSPTELLQCALAGEFEGAPVTLDKEARRLIEELTAGENIATPTGLSAQLRPYQQRGFSWMYRNSRIGFGSIIADDMGLGKTLQVIALLVKLREEGAIGGAGADSRALVVVPTGLLANWQAELGRFAPTLSSHIFHGATRDLQEFDADILLTSYGVLRGDAALLKKRPWRLMVIDEAQNIKNHDTALAKAIKSIPADCRIAMSGTPVENRLSEFWSIMDYANKGYLGTVKRFKEDYATPIQISGDTKVAEKFKKITAPFMMRRMKSDKSIIADLPDKIEQNQYAQLTKEQAALYQKTMEAAMREIEGIGDADNQSLFKRQGLVLQMILALKQICNHPAQFLKNGAGGPELSGKMALLFDLLASIDEGGEKALIFTQFREMGTLLQGFLAERFGEEPLFYHGGRTIKERNAMVQRFQEGRADRIFILSLKAAGTGLNLTAASQVIHYDLWWNPAVENQATDRAYRIGQDKNVMVHRFICKNTFEERIDAMIQKKKALADMTIASGESWIGKLSNTELREIFG